MPSTRCSRAAPIPTPRRSWRGQTALMWAAAEGHAPVIEALVARGANVHARSNGGFTPLLFAAREGRIAAVEALMKAGADMNDSLPVRRRPAQNASPTPAAPETGTECVSARRGQRSLRARGMAARSWRRSQRRSAGLYRAPSGLLGPEGRHRRQQQPGAAGIRKHGQPDVRASPRRERCATRYSRDQAPQHGRDHAQLDWGDPVSARRAHRGRTAHEAARGAWRQSPPHQRGRIRRR